MLVRLVTDGNTLVVIEHNLEFIAHADYVIDLGPGGGDEGGRIVAAGPPLEGGRGGEIRDRKRAAQAVRIACERGRKCDTLGGTQRGGPVMMGGYR